MPLEEDNNNLPENKDSVSSNNEGDKNFSVIKKNEKHRVFIIPHDNNSGDGEPAPKSIAEKFNWGAFLFNFVWGIKYKRWILLLVPFLCFVPYIGIIAALCLAFWAGQNGNQWAWEELSYKDENDFHESQKSWVKSWFVLFGISLLITGLVYLFNNVSKKEVEKPVTISFSPLSIPEKVYEDTVLKDKHSDFLGTNYTIVYWITQKSEQSENDYNYIAKDFHANIKKLGAVTLKPDFIDLKQNHEASQESKSVDTSKLCVDDDKMCVAKWLDKTCKSHYCILNMGLKQYYRVDKKEDVIPTVIKLRKFWN